MKKKLYRNTQDQMIAGVCSGLGDYFNIDPMLIRIVFALLLLGSSGSIATLYILLAILTPEGPASEKELDRQHPTESLYETPVTPPNETVRTKHDGF